MKLQKWGVTHSFIMHLFTCQKRRRTIESGKLFYQDKPSNAHGFSEDFVIYFYSILFYIFKSLIHLPFDKLLRLDVLIFTQSTDMITVITNILFRIIQPITYNKKMYAKSSFQQSSM